MVARQEKKEAVKVLMKEHLVSEHRACRVIDLPVSTFRYKELKNEDPKLIERMKYWAEKRPRYGHPRIHEMLKRDGFKVNHKKTERLYYKVLKLNLRLKRKRKRYRCETRVSIPEVVAPNEVWSMDFVSDQVSSGKRVRGLTVVDIFGRINLALDFDTSLTGQRVVGMLNRVCAFNGIPEMITVDNGPEFICMALDQWAYKNKVKLKFSRPGKPTDNAYIESFNGRLRDEFLNMHWFLGLDHLRKEAAAWRKEYNEERPHSSLKMLTPKEYLENYYNNNAPELTA